MNVFTLQMDQDIRGKHNSTSNSEIDLLRECILDLQQQVSLLKTSRNDQGELNTKLKSIKERSCDVSKSATVICLEDELEKDCSKSESAAVFSKPSYFTELCSSISLPGVRYIAQSEVPKLHRWLWVFIHAVALLFSVIYIQKAYTHWQSSPILQTINNSFTDVDEIPFPTITVCEPLNYNDPAHNVYKIIGRCLKGGSWRCSDEELIKLELSLIVLPLSPSPMESPAFSEKVLPIFHSNTTFSGMEYFRFSSGLKLDIRYSLHFTYPVVNRQKPKEQYLSLQGFSWCQTFNYIKNGPRYLEHDLKHELGFVKENSIQKQDNMPSTCNWIPENMLTNECRADSGIIYIKRRSVQASITVSNKSETNPRDLEVFIGSPGEYPHSILRGRGTVRKQLPRGKFVKILLSPQLITAGSDLSDIPIRNRGCAFSNEIKLSLFSYYTRHNCIFECQVNCALTLCGCIPYNIPVFNSSVRVCGYLKHNECQKTTNHLDYDICGCDCHYDCVSLLHDIRAEVSDREPDQIEDLVIKFEEISFPSNFRYSRISSFEFIAYSLGILGVFNGASVMLVWEIFYWLTLRLWSTIGATFGHNWRI